MWAGGYDHPSVMKVSWNITQMNPSGKQIFMIFKFKKVSKQK